MKKARNRTEPCRASREAGSAAEFISHPEKAARRLQSAQTHCHGATSNLSLPIVPAELVAFYEAVAPGLRGNNAESLFVPVIQIHDESS